MFVMECREERDWGSPFAHRNSFVVSIRGRIQMAIPAAEALERINEIEAAYLVGSQDPVA